MTTPPPPTDLSRMLLPPYSLREKHERAEYIGVMIIDRKWDGHKSVRWLSEDVWHCSVNHVRACHDIAVQTLRVDRGSLEAKREQSLAWHAHIRDEALLLDDPRSRPQALGVAVKAQSEIDKLCGLAGPTTAVQVNLINNSPAFQENFREIGVSLASYEERLVEALAARGLTLEDLGVGTPADAAEEGVERVRRRREALAGGAGLLGDGGADGGSDGGDIIDTQGTEVE
jgi:hypothetical protein